MMILQFLLVVMLLTISSIIEAQDANSATGAYGHRTANSRAWQQIETMIVVMDSTRRPRIMASILRVNTLTDASSNNSTAMSTINQGTAKAWVQLNGTGTIA